MFLLSDYSTDVQVMQAFLLYVKVLGCPTVSCYGVQSYTDPPSTYWTRGTLTLHRRCMDSYFMSIPLSDSIPSVRVILCVRVTLTVRR